MRHYKPKKAKQTKFIMEIHNQTMQTENRQKKLNSLKTN